MSAWSNNDKHNSKPKFDVERETREKFIAVVATGGGNTSGNNILTFTYYDGTASSNLSNVIAIGDYVALANIGANGISGFFKSNNTVSSISTNTVTFTSNFYGTVADGTSVEFDRAIIYNANKTVTKTYGDDTVLVTPTRLANNTVSMGNLVPGWTHIQKKTNNDGSIRYIHETLVALASPTAANTNSGNTSWGQAFTGV